MSTATKKPITIEYITWDEFIAYGKENFPKDAEAHKGFAWNIDYKGYNVTHENNECYLVPTLEGSHNFTPKDVLITGINGEIYPCKIDIFEKTYNKQNNKVEKMPHLNNALVTLAATNDKLDGYPISDFISIQGNRLSVSIQNGTIFEKGVNGIQITDLLKYVNEVYKSLNNAYPCKENAETIQYIQNALNAQENRTRDRVNRGVEGQNKI